MFASAIAKIALFCNYLVTIFFLNAIFITQEKKFIDFNVNCFINQ